MSNKYTFRKNQPPQIRQLALAVVVADATMLDAAIGLDVRHEGGGDDGDSGAGARGWDGAGTPRHWEIEGRGGHFWYEQAGRR